MEDSNDKKENAATAKYQRSTSKVNNALTAIKLNGRSLV